MVKAFMLMMAGGACALFFGLMGIVALSHVDKNDSASTAAAFVVIVLCLGGMKLFFMGRRRWEVYKAHKRYTHVLASLPISSLEELAVATKEPVASLVKKINQMRLWGLPLSFSDSRSAQPVPSASSPTVSTGTVNTAPAVVVVTCAGCGASNRVTSGIACVCEYCGSPLIKPE